MPLTKKKIKAWAIVSGDDLIVSVVSSPIKKNLHFLSVFHDKRQAKKALHCCEDKIISCTITPTP